MTRRATSPRGSTSSRCWTRREIGRGLLGGLAWAAMAQPAHALWRSALDGSKLRLRYVLASCLYGKTALAEILPEVKKTGAEELDVWPAVHADQREQMDKMGHERFQELLAEHGVRLGILTRYDLGPFRLQEEMKVAQELGARLIVTGSSGPKDLSGPEARKAVQAFLEQMKPHVAAAEEAGVILGIENHAGALLSSPDSLRHFAELATSPHLGVAFAPYHLPQDAELLGRLLREVGPKVVHYYAWQSFDHDPQDPTWNERDQLPGRGELDFGPMLAALEALDYRGTTSIFMHPTPRGIPIAKTTAEVTRLVNAAREYLEGKLG